MKLFLDVYFIHCSKKEINITHCESIQEEEQMNEEIIKENKAMKAAVIVSWVLIIGSTLAFAVLGRNEFKGFFDGLKATLAMLLIMIMVLGCICGAAHTSKIRKKINKLLEFPVIG